MSAEISIDVNGKAYKGWENVQLTTSLEALCGSFQLSTSNRDDWPVLMGDACAVKINGVVLLTGFVDKVSTSVSENLAVSVTGRDKACDLVDSSLLLDKWEFKGLTVLDLAKKICTPFGVNISLQSGLSLTDKIEKFTVDPGESGHGAIENLCRQAGVFAMSDGRGNILLTRASSDRAATDLVFGQNLKTFSNEVDGTSRYSKYVALGASGGGPKNNGQALRSRGEATDESIRSERILIIRPEGSSNTTQSKVRAQWEAGVRAGRSETASCTVSGWLQSNGTPWQVNRLARVRVPKLSVDGDFLISEVTFNLSVGEGATTDLALKRPDAFLPKPAVKKANKKAKGIRIAELAGGVP